MPNEKTPSSDELLGALEKAHLAGDTDAARELASWHYELYPPEQPKKELGILERATSLITGEDPTLPPKTEAQPDDGPSMRRYEPSLLDRVLEWGGGSASRKARASNELAARRIAAQEGIPVDEVYTSIGGSRPLLNPEGRAPVQALTEGAGVVAEQLPYVPQAAANTVLRVIRGGDDTADNTGWLDRAIDTTQPPEPEDPDPNYRAFYGIGESLGYSLATLTAATVAGAAGSATGTPVAGAGAAFTAGGAVAYRASKDQFLERVKEGLDRRSMELYGRPLNQQEWEDAYQKHEAAAQKYGAWEAIPEAVSNLIFMRALSLPLRGASRETITEVAKRAAQTMASEQVTETATAVGQSQAEAEAGMGKPLSVAEAFRQQAIQTALVTGLLGGSAAGARYGYDAAEQQIAPGRALGREFERQAEQFQAAPAPAGAAAEALAPENAKQVVQQPTRRPMADLVAEKLQERGVDPAILFKAADTGAYVQAQPDQQLETASVPFDVPDQPAAAVREQQTTEQIEGQENAQPDQTTKDRAPDSRPGEGDMPIATPDEQIPQVADIAPESMPGGELASPAAQRPTPPVERPALPPSYSVGPATVKTTPIESVTYRETGREGLESLIRATYVNAPGDSIKVHVADNRDLALGQGDNKGVMIQFRSGAISGTERQKPGITEQTGREFISDFVARDPIDQVLIPVGTKLSGFVRQALARNFDRQETPVGMLFTRKGAKIDQSLAESQRVTDMPAEGERRANDRARKLYDQMSREGLINELLTHELTGIKGRRSFVVESEGAKRIVSIDADSLKWINDNMAPEAGDRLLQAVANHLVEEFGSDYVYHISGDEFYLVDDGTLSGAQIAEGMRRVDERLGKATIEVEKAGEIVTKRGLSVTYGIGQNRRDADAELKREKTDREQRGQRAGRGQEPPGVSRRPAGPAEEPAAGRQGEGDGRADGGRTDEGPAPRPEVKKASQPTEYRILHRVSPSGEEFIVQSRIGERWSSSQVSSIEQARESIKSRGIDPDTAPVIRQEWNPKTKRYNAARPPKQQGGGGTHAMFAGAPAPANIYAAGTADGPMSNWQPIYRQLGVPPRPQSGKFTLGDRTIDLKPEDKPTRREGIRVMVQDIIGPRLYQGKIKGKSKLGFYRRRNSEVRTANYDDVEVMAHEMAHYLDFDKKFNKVFQKAYKSPEFSKEVQSVSYTSADRVVESEGFAEFVRLWLTQYDQARARVPKFTRKFEEILKEIPGLDKKMRRLQEEMHRWYLQGPRAQLRAKSGKELSQSQQVMQYMQTYPLERYRQEVIDKIHAAKVVERTVHGQIMDANASVYKQFQLVNGAESLHEAIVKDGTPTLNKDGSYSFNGKGLSEIFHPAARHGWERFNQLMDFFKAKRALELYQQGREHLFTGQEIAEGLKLADKYPEFREIFAEYQAFNGRMLDFYQQMGLIDKKQRAAFAEMNKAYVPFHRVIEKVEDGAGPGSPAIGKRLTGGSMNTKDIAENIIEGLYANVRGALIARAKQTLYKDIMKSQDGSLFAVKLGPDSKLVRADQQQMAEAVAGAMASLGFTVSKKGMILSGDIEADTITDTDEIASALQSNPDLLNFWTFGHKPRTAETYVDSAVIDGERVWFEVKSPLLVDMLTGMRGFKSGALLNAMYRVKNLQTRTVTSMLQFLGPNAIRDTLSAFVISKNRFIPVYSTLIGMGDAIFNTQTYKEFRLHGGGYGTRIEARTAETRSRRQLDLPSRNMWDAAAKLVAGWDRISSAFEYGSRLGDYRAARKAGKNPLEAAWEAREVSTDFSKIGRNELWAKFLRTVPFMNAGIQGLDKTSREIFEIKGEMKGTNLARLNAGKVRFLAAGGVLTLMTVLLWLLNKDDDRHKSLTDDQKARFWWIFIDGVDRPIKIPRPYDVGHIFATIPEISLDYVKDRDGDAAAEALAWTFANTLGIGDYPGILQPFVEVARNKKFTGAPVIPERLMDVPAEYQFRDSTPILYRQIGEQLGVSPLAAEHYTKGYLRYVEAYISDATEAMLWNEKEWGARPFSGSPADYLTLQFQGQSVPHRTKWTEGYYELKKRAAGVHQAMNVLQAQAIRDKKPLERFAVDKVNQTLIGLDQSFSEIDKAFRDQDTILAGIRYNKGLTAKEKEQQIEHYYKLKNEALAKFYTQASAALKKVETELPE